MEVVARSTLGISLREELGGEQCDKPVEESKGDNNANVAASSGEADAQRLEEFLAVLVGAVLAAAGRVGVAQVTANFVDVRSDPLLTGLPAWWLDGVELSLQAADGKVLQFGRDHTAREISFVP